MTQRGPSFVVESAHQAMATGFSIQIAGWSAKDARQVCREAFGEIDRLERLLSRFIDGSDIDRINCAGAGEPVQVVADTFNCVWAAVQAAALTGGAFDPTAGSFEEPPCGEAETEASFAGLVFNAETRSITKKRTDLRIDLGGIGKGFAIDAVMGFLREWDVPAALVSAGGSTAAAFGRPGLGIWSGQISHGPFSAEIDLAHRALASSGTTVKGQHIIDAKTGDRCSQNLRTWAVAPSAAVADALSTAFFVLPPDRITSVCTSTPDIGAAWIVPDQDRAKPPETRGVLTSVAWLAEGRG